MSMETICKVMAGLGAWVFLALIVAAIGNALGHLVFIAVNGVAS